MTQIVRGSPAAQVGFRPGDVVLKLNDRDVASVRALKGALREGDGAWTISVRRDGQVLNTTVRW